MHRFKVRKKLSLNVIQNNWKDCVKCEIGKHCRQKVFVDFFQEERRADMVFIGEGPGMQEDRQGIPFIGPAGQLLRQCIEKAETDCPYCLTVKKENGRKVQLTFDGQETYCDYCKGVGTITIAFTNLIACRPYADNPRGIKNRPPSLEEVEQCHTRLIQTLQVLNPSYVVFLGKEATEREFEIQESLGVIKLGYHFHPVKMYHPSYIVRNEDKQPELKDQYIKTLEHVFQDYWKQKEYEINGY